MPLLDGEQSGYYDHEPIKESTALTYLKCDISQKEGKAETIAGITNESVSFQISAPFHPVYVKRINGVEQLVYNSKIMEPQKRYRVTWNGEEFILVKNNDNVDVFKFFPGT